MNTQADLFEDPEDQFVDDAFESKNVDDVFVDAALLDIVKIDDLALDEEFIRFAQDLAWWNAKYSHSLKRYLLLKHNFEKVRARLWLEIREDSAKSDQRMTIEDIRAEVVLRDAYEEAHLALIDADVLCQRLRKDVDNIHAKKDMLQSLGAKLRVELEGDPTVRTAHREARRYGE